MGAEYVIKPGARPTATWEDVWEDLSSDVKLQLGEARGVLGGVESKMNGAASLLAGTTLLLDPGRL